MRDLDLAALQPFGDKFTEEAMELLDPAQSLQHRIGPHSPNPDAVKQAIESWKQRLA